MRRNEKKFAFKWKNYYIIVQKDEVKGNVYELILYRKLAKFREMDTIDGFYYLSNFFFHCRNGSSIRMAAINHLNCKEQREYLNWEKSECSILFN